MLGSEALPGDKPQINETLHRCEVPPVAEMESVVYIFLTNSIDHVSEEEATSAYEKLQPSGLPGKSNS